MGTVSSTVGSSSSIGPPVCAIGLTQGHYVAMTAGWFLIAAPGAPGLGSPSHAARVAGGVLHDGDGTQPDERDGHGLGDDAVARDAAGGVGGAQPMTDDSVLTSWMGHRLVALALLLGAFLVGCGKHYWEARATDDPTASGQCSA